MQREATELKPDSLSMHGDLLALKEPQVGPLCRSRRQFLNATGHPNPRKTPCAKQLSPRVGHPSPPPHGPPFISSHLAETKQRRKAAGGEERSWNGEEKNKKVSYLRFLLLRRRRWWWWKGGQYEPNNTIKTNHRVEVNGEQKSGRNKIKMRHKPSRSE